MAYVGPASGEVKEPGSRRRKFAGYLKAANELRQSYFQGGDAHPWGQEHDDDSQEHAFPDAAVARGGNEEMVFFPSYARVHNKQKNIPVTTLGDGGDQADYWRREWTRQENDKGVVDVDVRGWIYMPHRGPATRRQRLMIGLARQLSGISAPPSEKSDDLGQQGVGGAGPSRMRTQEEDLIEREAEKIVRRGNTEAEYAGNGAFSEGPGGVGDIDRVLDGSRSGKSSPERRQGSRSQKYSSLESGNSSDDSGTMTPLQKRESWAQPSKMSTAELTVANKHLLTRLKPFMATPIVEHPVQAFFYNDETSRQRTVFTNTSGHFSCRATLDFVPTHVRVLTGDNLSATEKIIISSPTGVSLISDIDDTIKHSAISAGAREIFRNAFIRDLGDLTVDGVSGWYNILRDMGVKLHFVSNSPWQMYPILTSFFKVAQLPRGSFHLKQYTGMLQGIFEPVAERKKSSLDKIMRDFPDRKFILVGDSGEADLEVYTDVVLDNPGRVLGVFIRDVTTTPAKTGYFDPSSNAGQRGLQGSRKGSGEGLGLSKSTSRTEQTRDEDADFQAAIAASIADMGEDTRRAKVSTNVDGVSKKKLQGNVSDGRGPPLPPRKPTPPVQQRTASPEEDLIDFGEVSSSQNAWLPSRPSDSNLATRRISDVGKTPGATASPPPPPKPKALQSPSPTTQAEMVSDQQARQPPPRPRKPSSAVKQQAPEVPQRAPTQAAQPGQSSIRPSPLSQVQRQTSTKERPPLPARKTYRDMAKEKFASVFPATGPWQDNVPSHAPRPHVQRSATGANVEAPRPLTAISPLLQAQRSLDMTPISDGPLPPPRRIGSASSFASLRKSSNRQSGGWSDDGLPSSPSEAGMSKKEFLWLQRWTRAKGILERQGVMLRSWRVGGDIQEVCVKLVESAIKEMDRQDKSSR